MNKLDVVRKVSDKALSSIPEEDKEALVLSELKQIENDKNFQKIKKMWDKLDDDTKMNTYNNGNIITVYGSSKLCVKGILPSLIGPLSLLFRSNRLKALSPVIRVLVHVGLLDAPKQLSQETFMENIQDDANNLDRNLKIFGTVSKVIRHPALQVASKVVSIIIPYADWYKEHGASLMQNRVKNQLESETGNNIVKMFSDSHDESQGTVSEHENIE